MFGNPMYAGMGPLRVLQGAWYAYRLTAEGIDHFTIEVYTLVDIPRLGRRSRRFDAQARVGLDTTRYTWQR